MPLLVNEFGLFQAVYLGHFLHDFHPQGVTLKDKVLANKKCIFQNYSQLLDIFTRLILKTTEKLIVPSVYSHLPARACSFIVFIRPNIHQVRLNSLAILYITAVSLEEIKYVKFHLCYWRNVWFYIKFIWHTLHIPALCQAISSMVSPRILVWSKSRVAIPTTVGHLF